MVKPITHGIKLLLVTLLLLLVSLMMFMASGPKQIPWLKPVIEKALSGKNSLYRVTIADAVIDWRSLERLGSIRLTRVEWESLDGQVFATLPEIDATLSLPHMLVGRAALRSVTLNEPRLFLVRDEQGEIKLGLEEDRAVLTLKQLMAPMLADDDDDRDTKMVRLPFKRFAIENAYMQMKDVASGGTLVSSPFTIRVGRDYSGAYAAISMPFVLEDEKSRKSTSHYIDGSAQWTRITGESIAHLQFDKVPGYLACMFTSCDPVKKVDGEFSGKVDLGFGKNFKLKDADITMNTTNSIIDAPEYFAEPLDIKKGYLSARVTDRAKQWVLNELNLKLKDTNFAAKGNAMKHTEGWSAQINAEAGPVPMKKLYKYWPVFLAPESREWVTTNIVAGVGRKATLAVTLQPKDFKQEVFPDHFLVSEIDAENLTINYLPGFPPVKKVNGHVKFTGMTMDARPTSGEVLTGTKVIGGSVSIPDLNAPSTPMKVDLNVTGPARDVATILAQEHFPFEDALQLNPEKIQGDVQGNIKLGFDAFSGKPAGQIDLDKVSYDIDAILKGIRQPKLWGQLDLQALDGTLSTTKSRFEFNGTTTIDDTNLKLSAVQAKEGPMKVNVNGTLGQKQFASVGLPALPEVKSGKAVIDAELQVKGEQTSVHHADIDLTDLELDVPQISWTKDRGVKGSLKVKQWDGHALSPNAYSVVVRADDLKADGEIATKDGEVAYVNVPNLRTNLNDFSLKYELKDKVDIVNLKGKRLDASAAYAREENSLLQDFPHIDLNVDMDEFVLTRTSPITQLKGSLNCRKRCTTANISGRAGNSSFVANIGTSEGARRFTLSTGDAGDFLKALDITDRVYKGALNFAGTYDDTQEDAPLNARFIIEKFNVKNSEILGRLLSIGSLTGLGNALTGEGIYFDKLAASMRILKGKVTVSDGKASGSSIGITIEGVLDTSTTLLNMKGVIVPANWINGFVGKIPIIGMLAGGSDEGLVAFRYSVDGKYSDPQVSVNPLSGFTPGFLRNIFNIFDQPPPDELKDVEPESLPQMEKEESLVPQNSKRP